MAENDRKQRLQELKESLNECNDFIQNRKKAWDIQLAEVQERYQEICHEIEETKQEYKSELARAERENFSSQQFTNLRNVFDDDLNNLEKERIAYKGYVEKLQKYIKDYPEYLKSALEDKEKIEVEIRLLESGSNNPVHMVIGAIIWFVIIAVIFRACSQ